MYRQILVAVAVIAALIPTIWGVARAVGAAMKWWYEVKELKRKDRERELNDDKERILIALRNAVAHPGLNGQTLAQIMESLQPKLSHSRIEEVLRSLANENPPRVHIFGERCYLGPLPAEAVQFGAKRFDYNPLLDNELDWTDKQLDKLRREDEESGES